MEIKNDQNESRQETESESPKSKLLPEFIQMDDQESTTNAFNPRRFLELFSPGF